MSSANRMIIAILVVAALAIGFWMLALGPKREEASELSGQLDQLEVSLAQAENELKVAEAARHEFPQDYRQLVVLGEAAPVGDETASLLVELQQIADRADVKFESLQLTSSGGEEAPAPAPAPPPAEAPSGESPNGVPASETIKPTEAGASLLPLGASIGPAGLGVMPYTLTFNGSFFEIADFLAGVDSLVATRNSKLGVRGRLVTVDGFSLSADAEDNGSLAASFVVTTYVTPPGEGLTAGASPSAPAPSTSAPAASEGSTGAAETSETVSAR